MTIAIETEITYIVIAAALAAKRRRPFNKFIIVEIEVTAFSIPIVNRRYLALKTQYRKILPIKVRYEDIIVSYFSINMIQETIGIFFQAPKPS